MIITMQLFGSRSIPWTCHTQLGTREIRREIMAGTDRTVTKCMHAGSARVSGIAAHLVLEVIIRGGVIIISANM